ncbi:MAG TPA: ROK family protein [Bellilinea sp.]|nr:ROK family protein [Bellilinea sp.]
MRLYGGIEAGGTKFVCAIGTGPEDIQAEVRFPTGEPEETLGRAIDFFRIFMIKTRQRLDGIGIGAFGPLDLNPGSVHSGKITTTPKAGWGFTDLSQIIENGTATPVKLDTDVNTAALGEGLWGAARDLRDYVYLTIGTGIGGGLVSNGKPHHGLVHPEMGHMRVPHSRTEDPFDGVCTFHGDCLEGLASGPAILARTGKPGDSLPAYHPVWDLEANYIALALANIVCMVSPQRILLGGGVMEQSQLFPMVRLKVLHLLNGYVHAPAIEEAIDEYIVPPQLGQRAGVLGAIALAKITFNPKGPINFG